MRKIKGKRLRKMESTSENNYVKLVGKVTSDKKFNHDIYGEKFYIFDLSVPRRSGDYDIIPIIISEKLLTNVDCSIGRKMMVEGQYRSYNSYEEGRSRIVLTVFAKKLTLLENQENEIEAGNGFVTNEVTLIGRICKKPIYRQTPFGREIADILLAVEREKYKSDYIPCIAGGRVARFFEDAKLETVVKLVGRIQTRQYEKRHEDGTLENKVKYEVSIGSLEVMKSNNHDESEATTTTITGKGKTNERLDNNKKIKKNREKKIENIFKNNYVEVCGKVISNKRFSHEIKGEKFYIIDISVPNWKKVCDIMPITISEKLIANVDLTLGNWIMIKGNLVSQNCYEDRKKGLIVTLVAQSLALTAQEGIINIFLPNKIELIGILCEKTVYSKTPWNKREVDIILEVKRAYEKSDYISCKAIGIEATSCDSIDVGTTVKVIGSVIPAIIEQEEQYGMEKQIVTYQVLISEIDIF